MARRGGSRFRDFGGRDSASRPYTIFSFCLLKVVFTTFLGGTSEQRSKAPKRLFYTIQQGRYVQNTVRRSIERLKPFLKSNVSRVTSLHHPFFDSTRCLVRVYTVQYEHSNAEAFMLTLLNCTSSVPSSVNSSVADPLYGFSQNTLQVCRSGNSPYGVLCDWHEYHARSHLKTKFRSSTFKSPTTDPLRLSLLFNVVHSPVEEK